MNTFLKNQINNRVYKLIELTPYEKDFLVKNNCFLSINVKNVCTLENNILNCTTINSSTIDNSSLHGIIKDLIYLTCKVNFLIRKHLKRYIVNYSSFYITSLKNNYTNTISIRIIFPIVVLPYNSIGYTKLAHIEDNITNILDITIDNIIRTYSNTNNLENSSLNEIRKFESDNGITIVINQTEE